MADVAMSERYCFATSAMVGY